ncbi:hypothetical protein [Pseudomonas japonica]|uniref:hypothetical protein n=1 Tax=Pseudomonas japonica TaxID=256466 RepID=UPI0015E3D43A|nr:hypothetical protein [Pseudomonas japonica]MBA1245820.1 hypothetical protein [Pseudomonas japonica]
MHVDSVLLIEVAGLSVALGAILVFFNRRKIPQKASTGLDVVFENGHLAVVGLSAFPANALSIPTNSETISQFRQLALDTGKASLLVPGRTLEVVFKPEIQEGLKKGTLTLMKTKDGEVLADAIDNATGKIVGKARLMEGGKIRQFASAGFQLVSIAVAQAHLAEIADGLRALNLKFDSITNRLESNDIAEIEGAIDYIRELAAFVQKQGTPNALSAEMANSLEATIRESRSWQRKALRHLDDLVKELASIQDLDTFGTGSTFEALKGIISRAQILLIRQDFYSEFASTVNTLTAFIDPQRNRFSPAKVASEEWSRLSNQMHSIMKGKVVSYLGEDVRFNRESTLAERRDLILTEAERLNTRSLGINSALVNRMSRIEQMLAVVPTPGQSVRMALTIDTEGNVTNAGIVPTHG